MVRLDGQERWLVRVQYANWTQDLELYARDVGEALERARVEVEGGVIVLVQRIEREDT